MDKFAHSVSRLQNNDDLDDEFEDEDDELDDEEDELDDDEEEPEGQWNVNPSSIRP